MQVFQTPLPLVNNLSNSQDDIDPLISDAGSVFFLENMFLKDFILENIDRHEVSYVLRQLLLKVN